MNRNPRVPALTTERVYLRYIILNDAPRLFEIASNPNVTKFLSYTPHKNVDESRNILAKWIEEEPFKKTYRWAILHEPRMIGTIEARIFPNNLYNLGWQLDEKYWGKGFMTEAANAVIEWLFAEKGAEVVEATADIDNIGSWRVMEKTGMKRISELTDEHKYLYQITREEYLQKIKKGE